MASGTKVEDRHLYVVLHPYDHDAPFAPVADVELWVSSDPMSNTRDGAQTCISLDALLSGVRGALDNPEMAATIRKMLDRLGYLVDLWR